MYEIPKSKHDRLILIIHSFIHSFMHDSHPSPFFFLKCVLLRRHTILDEVHAYLRTVLANLYDDDVAQATRIQYGGSVTPDSVDELMSMPEIDGCLVGGASLDAEKFGRIINYKKIE